MNRAARLIYRASSPAVAWLVGGPVVECERMLEPQPAFGLLHILGMAIVGCLAFAIFTDEWLWTGLAVAAAGALAAWAWVVAKRQYGDEDRADY